MNKQLVLSALLALAPMASVAQDMDDYGPDAGESELTLSGTGASDQDLDNGTFGVSGDWARYMSEQLALGVRQSLNYAQIENADDAWNGATRGFVNYHFGSGAARPFIGASLGGVYGDGVSDTGFAGPEAGLKYYVRSKTFVFGRAEYQFFFDSSDEFDDNFDDGSFVYSVGLGYNY